MKKDFKKQAKDLVKKMTIDEKISQLWHTAPAIERLGVPAYNWWSEAPHGAARCGVATVFPQSIGMAASFNSDLLKEVGNVVSDEVRAKYNEYKKQGYTDIYQGLTVCGPVINIARDPRWGRNCETYGEDPYLTGRMGAAYISGLQGDKEYRKVDSVVQHFAVHSGPENGRLTIDYDVSEKDLFETYLWAFEYCIKNADPSMILPAYNRFRGLPCCANEYLLKDVLRDRFGFKRVTMSDASEIEICYKIQDKCKTEAEMAAWCVNSGTDVSIGDEELGFIYKHLKEAYDKGLITEEKITDCVERVFELRFEKGLFADDCEFDNIPYEILECDKHREINKKMAHESIVLLKNDGILPLKKDMKVAVIGPNADEKLVLLGNYYGYATHTSTFLQGIRNKTDEMVYFARGYMPSFGLEHENDTPMYESVIAAQKSDVIVMFMGLDPTIESEECDFSGDKKDLEMPEKQKILYDMVKDLGKPIVYVNVSGSCVNLEKQKDECSALIQCFYPGAEGGDALADILYGDVSPSGRLPLTFYRNLDDLPPIAEYAMENRTYKFYKGTPLYEFGYGLSYSDIEEKKIDRNTVELTNHGPYDTMYATLRFENIPHKCLTGFEKVFLKVGETKTVTFRDEILPEI